MTPQPPHLSPAPRPADPLLASRLLDDDALERLLETCLGEDKTDALRDDGAVAAIRTGAGSVDDALGGGVQAGDVLGVCCGEGSRAGEAFSQRLLVDSLFKYAESTAAVVDTTGNFDVVALYAQILARLQHDADARSLPMAGEAQEVAARMLDRVRMMRVFDLEGMQEAVEEVRVELEGRAAAEAEMGRTGQENIGLDLDEQTSMARKTVADSEGEDEGEDADEDEEMLFTNALPYPHPTTTTTTPPTPKFLLITNIAHVLTPLFKKNYTAATLLTSPFLTLLAHLTQKHALHTLLLTPCVVPRDQQYQNQNQHQNQQQHQQQQPYGYGYRHADQQGQMQVPAPSRFASRRDVPVLLGVVARAVEVLVMVWGDGKERGKGKGQEEIVVEVLADRYKGRVGAWGVMR